jgi:hypothetical protein
MSFESMLRNIGTKVMIYRDDKKILETKAAIQGDEMFFENVDVKELDIIEVPAIDAKYRVVRVDPILKGNQVHHKEVKVDKILS